MPQQVKRRHVVRVFLPMLVRSDEHHTQIKNPRSENRGFFTQRSDFIEAIYWIYDIGNPQKLFFDDQCRRFVSELRGKNTGILCVLWDFHKKKLDAKIRPNRKR